MKAEVHVKNQFYTFSFKCIKFTEQNGTWLMVHVKLFISYAHKDDESFSVFKPAIRQALAQSNFFSFDAWEDSRIPLGSDWHQYIQNRLQDCKIAILCVSDNFFASKYIQESEFNNLVRSYNKILIVPVYFNSCDISTWQDFSAIQFFKPRGFDYGLAALPDFSFSSLVNYPGLAEEDRKAGIQKYCEKLSLHIQQAYIDANFDNQETKKLSDRIVTYVMIAAIIGALIFTFYALLFEKETREFNSIMGGSFFFGSFAAFTYNKKSH